MQPRLKHYCENCRKATWVSRKEIILEEISKIAITILVTVAILTILAYTYGNDIIKPEKKEPTWNNLFENQTELIIDGFNEKKALEIFNNSPCTKFSKANTTIFSNRTASDFVDGFTNGWGLYNSGISTIVIFEYAKDYDRTYCHEVGHSVYYKELDEKLRDKWKQYYSDTLRFTTRQSKDNPSEYFAEYFACYFDVDCMAHNDNIQREEWLFIRDIVENE